MNTKNGITVGAYGVIATQDNSPLYIVQRVSGETLYLSERYDAPPSDWVKTDKNDFWCLT